MFRLIQTILVFLPLILAACTLPPKPATTTATKELSQARTGLLIKFTREGCAWHCPIYQLTIDGEGNVLYEGIGFVNVEGIRRTQINSQQIHELVTEIEEANFFELEDRYVASATDLDSVTLSITLNEHSKSIWHYGVICSDKPGGPPMGLCELEDLIDEITNSSQWVGQK